MSQDISNYIEIVVPGKVYDEATEEMNAISKVAGGATIVYGMGVWHDEGETYHEEVAKVRFNFSNSVGKEVLSLCQVLVDKLFSLGEKAVMRERHYSLSFALAYDGLPRAGFKAEVLFK